MSPSAPLKSRLRAEYPLLRRRLRWAFAEPVLGWLSLLLAGFSLYLPLCVRLEVCIRWWGMVLQLIGVTTVVLDLYFRIPEEDRVWPWQWLYRWFRQWLRRWPSRSGGITISPPTGAVVITGHPPTVTVGTSALPSTDERVAALERLMEEASKSLDRAHQGISQEREEREARLNKQAADTAAAIAGVRSRVEDVAVGTLPVSMFGVWWLAVGVVLSTAAPELARWAHRLPW